MKIRFVAGVFLTASLLALGATGAVAGEVLDGFGNNIRLSDAVRQIVPGSYDVSFGNDVDVQGRVSWEGGRDWRAVLDETLAKRGLVATVEGRRVRVTRTGAPERAAIGTPAVARISAPGLVVVPYVAPPAPAAELASVVEQLPPVQQAAAEDAASTKSSVEITPIADAPQAAPPIADAEVERARAEAERARAEVEALRAEATRMRDEAQAEAKKDGKKAGGVRSSDKASAYPVEAVRAEGSRRSMIDLKGTPDVTVLSRASGWRAQPGSDVQEILADWAEAAGWTLVWNSPFAYPVQAGATFDGDFIEAASNLVRSMSSAKPAMKAAFYRGNKTLVVTTSSDEQN